MAIENKLIGIALGIRFRANFSIEDSLGEILDTILYSKESYFNPLFFPLVQNRVNEKLLYNKETNNYIMINNSNIILEVNFKSPQEAYQVEQIEAAFEKQIIKGVLDNYKITQINRIGYINKYVFDDPKLAKDFLDKTIGNTIDGANDINLRFSKKYAIEKSLLKAGVNDYHNAIFNVIKKAEKEELFFSVDYQRHFLPALERGSHVEFSNYLESVSAYNNSSFVKWLNSNYGITL